MAIQGTLQNQKYQNCGTINTITIENGELKKLV
jgi:hypothetical protein